MGASGWMDTLDFILDLYTCSENNMHGHWRAHATRARTQRSTIYGVLATMSPPPNFVCATVYLERISPRELDGDNLQGALKAVRDGVTDWMSGGLNKSNRKGGTDDRDLRIKWLYSQSKGKPKNYGVRLHVHWEENMPVFLAGVLGTIPESTGVIVKAWLCLRCMQVSASVKNPTGKSMCTSCGNEFTAFYDPKVTESDDDAPHDCSGETGLREADKLC